MTDVNSPLSTVEKTRARSAAKAARAALPHGGSAQDIIAHFPAQRFRGKVIAGFWPLKDEIDTRPLLQALSEMGETLCLPCVGRAAHPLVFRRWTAGDALVQGPYGVMESPKSASLLIPDIVLVPLLAFTSRGERLGYGGGYYDRTLFALRSGGQNVFACGVALAGQERQDIPVGPYDQPLDAILTEAGFRKF